MHRIGMTCIALAALSLCAAGAAAQTTQPQDLEQDARLHFELGERHFQRGELEEAAEEFEEAYRLSHRAPLLYNLYVTHRDAGHDAQAADALRRYLAAAPDAPNRARLEVVLRNLEERLSGAPAPSSHDDSSSTTTPAETTTQAVDPASIALLAAGGAVLIGAITTGAIALSGSGDLATACPNDACPESARGLASEVSALSITTDVLWPVGTVLAGIGLAWLIASLTAAPPSRSVDVDVAASQNGVVIGARGRF